MRHRDIIDVQNPCRPFLECFGRDVHDATIGAMARDGATGDQLKIHREFQSHVLAELNDILPQTANTVWHRAFYNSMVNPEKSRAWKARALNVSVNPHNGIALSGMAPINDGERWLLGVAYPSPPPFGPRRQDITDIILIDPKTGNASLYGDTNPSLIAPLNPERFTVHADARVWAREIATQRLEWFYSLDNARRQANATPEYTGYPQSALLIGDVMDVRWPKSTSITAGTGVDAKKLRSALFRQARIPHVEEPLALGRAA